jgi:hypothetical protein
VLIESIRGSFKSRRSSQTASGAITVSPAETQIAAGMADICKPQVPAVTVEQARCPTICRSGVADAPDDFGCQGTNAAPILPWQRITALVVNLHHAYGI